MAAAWTCPAHAGVTHQEHGPAAGAHCSRQGAEVQGAGHPQSWPAKQRALLSTSNMTHPRPCRLQMGHRRVLQMPLTVPCDQCKAATLCNWRHSRRAGSVSTNVARDAAMLCLSGEAMASLPPSFLRWPGLKAQARAGASPTSACSSGSVGACDSTGSSSRW